MTNRSNNVRRIALSGMLFALAMALSVLEGFLVLPGLLPGMKLGLANVVVMYALLFMGAWQALVLDLLCCNVILKPLVGRVRPCDVNTAVKLLIARPLDASFPSGHTAVSFAAVCALWAERSRLWIPALALALLLAFSRLYLYVHWPSDVLAGAVLGGLLGLAARPLARRLFRGIPSA